MNPRSLDRRWAFAATCLLIALLMLPNLIWLAHDPSGPVWVSALVLPLAMLSIWFAALGRWPWIACVLLTPLALLAPLETYYVALYHHPTSAQIIATIVATNPLEAREYFGRLLLPLVLLLLAGAMVALVAARATRRAGLRWRGYTRLGVLGAGIVAMLVPLGVGVATSRYKSSANPDAEESASTSLRDYGYAIEDGYPFGVIARIAVYRHEWNRMRAEAAKFKAFRFHAHRIGAPLRQRQVYVLVIGESSRRANWQLFGYGRATNPELSKLKNLVPITHFISTWPESIAAIPMILTRRKPDMAWDAPWHEASVLRAMQEAGYETYWISNQQAIGEFDSPVSMYAYEAEHVEWLNHASWTAPGSYDGDLIRPLKDALRTSDKDLFIVLHMMGSHVKYDYRYPPCIPALETDAAFAARRRRQHRTRPQQLRQQHPVYRSRAGRSDRYAESERRRHRAVVRVGSRGTDSDTHVRQGGPWRRHRARVPNSRAVLVFGFVCSALPLSRRELAHPCRQAHPVRRHFRIPGRHGWRHLPDAR